MTESDLTAQVEAGRKINDQLMQSSASDSRMILRLQGEVRAAVARADAAEARLTRAVELGIAATRLGKEQAAARGADVALRDLRDYEKRLTAASVEKL